MSSFSIGALEERPGKTILLSTVYRMLHRHGWRKSAPDKGLRNGDHTQVSLPENIRWVLLPSCSPD
ncbi:MAG: helix-turn-helix domain-containing protein [Leptospirales bacterium]